MFILRINLHSNNFISSYSYILLSLLIKLKLMIIGFTIPCNQPKQRLKSFNKQTVNKRIRSVEIISYMRTYYTAR